MKIEDKILLNEIQKQNREVFKALFHEYYPHLIKYTEGFIFDKTACQDIVQNLFIYFWENSNKLEITESIKAYLYKSVKNRCLNYLRELQIKDKHRLLYLEARLNDDEPEWIDVKSIQLIKESIDNLPPQMAEVFKLKYLHGKKYKEIAELNNISENTVKTQLKRAKRKLRAQLLKTSHLNYFL